MALALDSNILWAFLDGEPGLRERLDAAGEVWLPLPTLGEAHYTVLNSGRRRENEAKLGRFLQTCHVPAMGPETARRYAEVRMELRRKVRPIPENDIWIAAVCLEHGLPFATRDANLNQDDGMEVLAW